MDKLTRKTYNKKLAKQFIAENEFKAGKSNAEVCDYLNMVCGKTSPNDVEVMKHRFEKKKKKMLNDVAMFAIDTKEVKNSVKQAIFKVTNGIATSDLEKKEMVDLFKTMLLR